MTKELLTQEELQKATLEIAQKSAVDADFREKFIADPKSVVGEILGKKLSDDTVIDVFDSRPEVITTYIVPAFIGADKGITLTPPVLVAGEDWTPQEYADTVHYILNKTAIDADFRKDFLANPRSVIEQQAGKKIPESFLFDVKEVRPEADLTFALPRFVGEEGLTDEELMMIAGGKSCKQVMAIVGYSIMGAAAIVGGVAGAIVTVGASTTLGVAGGIALISAAIATAGGATAGIASSV
jgi:predicted phage tail protein